MLGSATQTVEIVTLQKSLDEGRLYDLGDRAKVREAIAAIKQIVVTGLADPVAQRWTKKLQKEVEPLLRMRLDPRFGYVIDRWVESHGYWHQIPGVIGFDGPKPGLCERMRTQYDMWKKSSPKDDEAAMKNEARHPILKEKDAASNKIKSDNEQASTAKVMAAVDSLPQSQIDNFLAVERARHTGEKIIHHGEDLKFVEMVEEKQKTNPAPPEDMGRFCGNPGMHPKLHKRKSGGKHILEK